VDATQRIEKATRAATMSLLLFGSLHALALGALDAALDVVEARAEVRPVRRHVGELLGEHVGSPVRAAEEK